MVNSLIRHPGWKRLALDATGREPLDPKIGQPRLAFITRVYEGGDSSLSVRTIEARCGDQTPHFGTVQDADP